MSADDTPTKPAHEWHALLEPWLQGMGNRKGEMKYVAARLTAITVLVVSGFLSELLEDPVRNLMGWLALDPSMDMRWWRAGGCSAMAVWIFCVVVKRHNDAALKWRKELAARARA